MEKDWDEVVPFVLFAIQDARQECLGFSPAELVFGHNVRRPLKVLKEQFVHHTSPKLNVSDFVSQCREDLHCVVLMAKKALSSSQTGMKRRFHGKAVQQHFWPSDEVLVLLHTSGSALTTRLFGLI